VPSFISILLDIYKSIFGKDGSDQQKDHELVSIVQRDMRTAVQKMIEGIMKNIYKDDELLKVEADGNPDASSLPPALASLGTTPTR